MSQLPVINAIGNSIHWVLHWKALIRLVANVSFTIQSKKKGLTRPEFCPAEIDFPFQEATQFYDLESGRELYIDPEDARQQYQQRFQAHATQLRELCQRLGIDQYDLPTNQPLELALFDLIQARMRRGRQVARRGAITRRTSGTGGR